MVRCRNRVSRGEGLIAKSMPRTAALESATETAQTLHWLRGLTSEVIRRGIFPVYQHRLTPSAFHHLREIRKWEFSSLEELQRVQWRRLQNLVQHAARHVPYYRESFRQHGIAPGDIGSPRDFARIPVLTKSTLQAKVNELIAENRERGEGQQNASGGSTGKPVQFYQDRFYWEYSRACQWFVEGWWGIRPGDRTASVWGCDRDLADLNWRERLYAAITQTRVCNAFSLTARQMEQFARMLMVWQPRHLTGYASALEVFARFLLERPQLRIRPRAVKSSAEVLTDKQRAIFQSAFQAPVYNFYGSREVNNLAAECPAQSGLHVNALARYIEVVDDNANPLPARVPGRILLTDLTNYFMPFIRYEIEDVGSWAPAPCGCGRPFPLLAGVWGRSSDFIVTPAGKIIHGEFFTHLFYDLPQVSNFQVVQESLRVVRVQLVLRSGGDEEILNCLRNRLSQALGPEVSCEVRTVSRIHRPASGKHRFTVSSVPIPWRALEQDLSNVLGEQAR